MCGIACIVELSGRPPDHRLLELMNTAAAHRGPDGTRVSIVGNVGLAAARLAIIDLSEAGIQPIARGRHRLCFNGEIYNYRELRAELAAKGRVFKSQSDTEVLLAALEHWGMVALERLKGMFAFIYLDEEAGALYLARDRFGQKPLAYSQDSRRLIAASESKQILAAQGATPKVNMGVALQFLDNDYLNGTEETFFAGIKEVKPGHYLRLDLKTGAERIVQWYDVTAQVERRQVGYAEARDRVRELLMAAVRRRHIADVEVGACLSGGIDSSSIVALSATLFPQKRLRTISSYAEGKGFDERLFSRAVAEKFSLDGTEIRPDTARIWRGEFLKEICYYQDQPVDGGSQYNEWCVFEAARRAGLIVMLDGQGADEYFGGYGEFWLAAQLELLKQGRVSAFLSGIAARAEAQGVSVLVVMRRFLANFRARKRPAGQNGWLKLDTPAAERRMRPGTSFFDLSIEELRLSSLPFQVHSEDRNAMRWSVESRLPFLDHELVEYVLGLPTEFKCHNGVQKNILRDAVAELPPVVARRKEKIGFAAPDAETCFRQAGAIRAELEAALDSLSDILRPELLLKAFDRMVAERSRYDALFFRLLSFAAWKQVFRCGF